jgi:hypothetical protein
MRRLCIPPRLNQMGVPIYHTYEAGDSDRPCSEINLRECCKSDAYFVDGSTPCSAGTLLLGQQRALGGVPCQYTPERAVEARLRHAKQDTPPSQTAPTEFAKQPPECARQQAGQADRGKLVLPLAEATAADERQAQLRTIASDLLYWKGGLKVLRQAQLPTWRGCFQWQIEALKTAYARLRVLFSVRSSWCLCTSTPLLHWRELSLPGRGMEQPCNGWDLNKPAE